MSVLIDMGTAAASTLGTPSSGTFFVFFNSENSNKFTTRDSLGVDTVYSDSSVDLNQLGWVQVADTTYTSGSPFSVSSGVRTKLLINSDSVIESSAPTGLTAADFYDDSTNKVLGIQSGDAFAIRLDFTANPTLNNRNLFIEFDIGGAQGVIFERLVRLARGAGVDSPISTTNFYYTLGTFVANGMEIYVECDGDVDLFDFTIVLSRVNLAK